MKYLLLIGSNSDVGQACAKKYGENGYNIYLATRTIDEYQKRLASDLMIRYGIIAQNLHFDATIYASHNAFYESLEEKPEIVISVFGYLGNHEKALVDFNEAYQIIAANFLGNVSVLNIVANDMEKRKQGTIICVSSVAGERGRKSNYIYGSAKAGLTAYLSGLRNRLYESNVHVSTIIPGFIRTKMIPGLKTPGPITAQPVQLADAIWKAHKKRKDVVYVLPIWQIIMLIIKIIPEKIYKKMSL